MASPDELARLLRDALTNYYDPVRLQSHPLAEMLDLQRGPGETVAEALRRCLRDGIDRLRPPNATPQDGPEWLGHRVLLLHYVRSLSPAEVCRELNMSEATFYRRQREALQALSSVMWNAHRAPPPKEDEPAVPSAAQSPSEVRERAIALASRLPSQLVQLAGLLEGVRQTIAPLAEQQHITLQVMVPKGLPPTYGDPAVLRHAILALLTECVCAARNGTVELRVWSEGGRIVGRIAVLGSDASGAAGCFEEGHGFRLGLELLQVYGGEVWREPDAPGCGVGFAVATLQPTTLLIVDDDATTADLYRRYLEGPQYAVTHAQTAEEVEAALERSLPDIILLDVLLPRRDGWLILETIKSEPSTARIPVIVCSVIEQPELALALGAAQVLTKPITSEELLRAVQEQTLRANSRGSERPAGPARV